MRTRTMTLASHPAARAESRSWSALPRQLLLAAALLATAGALATAVLDILADASAPRHLAPVAAQVPVAAGGGDPSLPDARSVFLGREVAIEEPVATF